MVDFNVLQDLIAKSTAQKEETEKKKVQNEQHFNFINRLLAQSLAYDQLKAQLAAFAQQNMYATVADLLNTVTNSYGVTPLQKAFKDQNFTAAKQLTDMGANFGARERAEFDIALDCDAVKKTGLIPSAEPPKFHAVKKYGLTLGLEMTAKDGTHSQIAHIEPTYKMVEKSAADYAKQNSDYAAIADAFKEANRVGQFSRSTSRNNPGAGQELAKRIQDEKITTIPIGCKGHFMGLSVIPDPNAKGQGYLAFTNCGIGCTEENCGTQIYRIDDLKKISPEFINNMMNGLSKGLTHEEVMAQIQKVTDNKEPIKHIPQDGQEHDNCSVYNAEKNIEGIRACQKAIHSGRNVEALSEQDYAEVRADHTKYEEATYNGYVKELISDIENNPTNEDYVNIGKNFLEQQKNNKFNDATLVKNLETALHGAEKKASKNADSSPDYAPPSMMSPP